MDKNSLKYLVWLSQLGFSLVVPPVLFLLGGLWLMERFALGAWMVVVCLIFGLITAWMTAVQFGKMMSKKAKIEEKPRFFTNHD